VFEGRPRSLRCVAGVRAARTPATAVGMTEKSKPKTKPKRNPRPTRETGGWSARPI
jgi:hypothetical protein